MRWRVRVGNRRYIYALTFSDSSFQRKEGSGGEGDQAQDQAQRKGEELHFIGDAVYYVVAG